MIRKHKRCRGLRIWKWNSLQVEVWFCPSFEYIEPHVHERIDSTIVMLLGDMAGTIGKETGLVRHWKRYRVPAGVKHSASVGLFCIFANVERWQGEPTSAADDFTAA